MQMANPAAPILASSIWLAQGNPPRKELESSEPARKRRKLATGVKAINDAWEGGLDFGSVHCITSQPGHGPRDVVQELLVSHLLSEPTATATVVDSTLSFDVRGLFHILLTVAKDRHDAVEKLDRLKISKVFDFVGLTEAIAELRDTLETTSTSTAGNEDEASGPPRGTVADSEDEEDEMLDTPILEDTAPDPEPSLLWPSCRLLIIDNISHVTAPLIKNNYPQGQALLTAMMRSLGHLTRTHDLCTVVLSNALTKSSADDETLSGFKSCTIRPVLGLGLGYLVDTHIYLHQQPRKAATAFEDGAKVQERTVEMASVFEVVQDKVGGRFGRWAAFMVGETGRLVDIS